MVLCLLLLAISCVGCSGIGSGLTKVADAITNPTAREVYAREFKGGEKIVYDVWESAYRYALNDSITVSLPYGEKGTFNPVQNHVYSYNIDVKEGEVLVAEIQRDSLNHRVFMDIFENTDSGYKTVKSAKEGDHVLQYEPKNSGILKIVIQPEMAANTDFFISINKQPLYTTFPVAGKGNSAIMSFWGMERDGGIRKHEGIDIFAQKGTPVVATTDGFVTYTGERGLGGKQVWLRDGLFGASLYYAHLDAIKVNDGARVKAGDTLGFVGNTGNARFTPPHLHFGIYRSFGAVDPLPFVYKTDKISQKQYSRTYKPDILKVKGKANLRQGPSTKAPVLGTLGTNEKVMLLGQSRDWLHVQTVMGMKAFISKSLVKT
jgi:murein DD-endopeptidase MepM/ murein hydrolase activator NlpD